MAGKKIDWAGMLAVYDQINKQRPLTEDELDRVEFLNNKLKRQQYSQKYESKGDKEARNKQKLAARRKFLENNPEKAKKQYREFHQRHKGARNSYSRANWKRYNADGKASEAMRQRRLERGMIKVHIVENGKPICNNSRANLALSGDSSPTCGRCLMKRNKIQRESINVQQRSGS